jgi:hypothetical protein
MSQGLTQMIHDFKELIEKEYDKQDGSDDDQDSVDSS